LLIIFDLDDTLIDTTGQITPFKMRLCLKRLQGLGLSLGLFEEAYQELMAINAVSLSSSKAIKLFIEKKGGEPGWLASALAELSAPLPSNFFISTTPFAKQILEELKRNHSLALVTGGNPAFQREKMEKAGIEPTLFSNILIPEDSVKKPSYEVLTKEFLDRPRDVVVCGDRILIDLAPAYELGFVTVHMRWGRGLINQTEPWIDYSISSLSELKGIV
jgi:FMN phosphatase YigB (HAD superfamily)